MAKKSTAAQKAETKEIKVEATVQAAETQPQTEAPAMQYTEDMVQEMIAKAVAKALAEQQEKAKDAAIPGANDMVTMRFAAEVNDRNVVYLGKDGKYGQIIGKRWTGQIPKMAFIGDFRTPLIQRLLETRNLIVLDGLTEDERRLYGVAYAEGEVIDEKLYDRLTRMEEKDLLPIYRALCPEWRRMIAVRFADAFDAGTLKVSRHALLELNKISRRDNKGLPKDDIRRKGAFWQLIQKLNYAEEADEE